MLFVYSLMKLEFGITATLVFGSVVIFSSKNPLYEGVGLTSKIFKIYTCEFRLEFLSYLKKKKKRKRKRRRIRYNQSANVECLFYVALKHENSDALYARTYTHIIPPGVPLCLALKHLSM
jgi:hypothetical protein